MRAQRCLRLALVLAAAGLAAHGCGRPAKEPPVASAAPKEVVKPGPVEAPTAVSAPAVAPVEVPPVRPEDARGLVRLSSERPPERPRYCHRERFAVCIGINEYAPSGGFSTLKYAGNDAVELAVKLADQCGFEHVLLMTDAALPQPLQLRLQETPGKLTLDSDVSHRNIEDRVGEFLAGATAEDDLVLLYFAGHGASPSKHQAFLVPGDFSPQARHKNIPIEAACHYLYRYPIAAKRKVVLLDACRSGHAMEAGFAAILGNQDPQLIIMASCDKEQSALEDPKLQHGRFTWALIRGIEKQFNAQRPLWLRDVLDNVHDEFEAQRWTEQKPKLFAGVVSDNPRYFPLYYPPPRADQLSADDVPAALQAARDDYQANKLEDAAAKYASCVQALETQPQKSYQPRPPSGIFLVAFQASVTPVIRAEYARVLYRLGQLEESARQLAIAEELVSAHPVVAEVQGYRLLDRGEFAAAEARFPQAFQDGNPENAPFLISRRGHAFRHLGQYSAAANQFLAAAKLAGDQWQPDEDLYYYRLGGECQLQAGEFRDALAAFELIRDRLQKRAKSPAQDLRLAESHQSVAAALKGLKNDDAAAAELAKARQIEDAVGLIRVETGPEPAFRWRVLHADGGRVAATIDQAGALDKALPAGRYRLAMKQFQYEGEEVIFPDVIDYRPGDKIPLPARSGIRIERPAGTGPLHRWQVTKEGKPKEIVQWHHGEHTVMVLPPGHYQVCIQPIQYASEDLAWGEAVTVQPGELTTLRLDSTIQLDWPEQSGPLYSWSVATMDKPKERLQWQRGDQLTMLMPPGRYQVKTYPIQYSSEELAWPEAVSVQPGQQARLRADSTIQLDWPVESGPLYSWSVASLDKPKERLQWQRGDQRTMALPPGRYLVTIYAIQYGSEDLAWPEAVTVTAGQHSTIRLDSTLQLDWPQESGPLYSWSVSPVDKPSQRTQWQYGDKRLMLLPPGSYRVTVQPVQYNSSDLVWPAAVAIEAGERAKIRLDSTVRLDVPAEFGALYSWSVAPVDKPDQRVQWQRGEQRTMLVPPGRYHVTIEPTQYNSKSLVWPEAVETAPGKQAVSKLASGIRLAGPAAASPEFELQIIRQGETEPLQWARQTWTPQIVPPGTYRVELRKNNSQPWQPLADNIRVEAGRIAEVTLVLPK